MAGFMPNFKQMGITMGIAFLSQRFIDVANPAHLFAVRGVYLLSQVFCYGLVGFLFLRAKNNTDPGVLTVKEDLGFGQQGEREEKITVSEHDMRQCKKEAQRFIFATLITMLLHLRWNFVVPLMIQAYSQTNSLMQTPLVKVTLLKERAWGELSRPWDDPGAFGKQWTDWNNTIEAAMSGKPAQRVNAKKAAKKEAKRAAKKAGKSK